MAQELTFSISDTEWPDPASDALVSLPLTMLIRGDGASFEIETYLVDEEPVTLPSYFAEFFGFWLYRDLQSKESRVRQAYCEELRVNGAEERANSHGDYINEQRAA